jgi:prophage DNA circulation protein
VTWREDLRRVVVDGNLIAGSSFRGVPFLVQDSERTGGRRVVRNSFPFRDVPFVEDLGRQDRSFKVEGYVLGDDYMVKRNALMSALEDVAGPGQLVHVFHGVLRAICDTVSVKETRDNGGIAMFSIVFCEAPTFSLTPTTTVDNVGKVDAAATSARTATKAELVEQFTVAGLPAFALTSAESALRSASDFVGRKLAPVASTTQELATLNGRITVLLAQASALVRAPASAIDDFGGAIDALADTIEATPGAVLDALVDAYGFDAGPDAPVTTATRRTERANQIAITAALRRVLAIEAARIAPTVEFASVDDAIAARDRLAALLDEQAAIAADTAYPALVSLRSAGLLAVPGPSVFARTLTISRPVAVPSLLLAYQLYGSVDQELDIVARNNVRHPGFVRGDLKVLSNG